MMALLFSILAEISQKIICEFILKKSTALRLKFKSLAMKTKMLLPFRYSSKTLFAGSENLILNRQGY